MTSNMTRKIIVKCLDTITDCILYFKLHRPLAKEKDPNRRLEKKIWLELRGAFLGGMAGDAAWTKYKTYYYNKISNEDEKISIRNTLLSMLKSQNYKISEKALISYVCADLEIREALPEITTLLQIAQDRSDVNLFRLSYEALSRKLSVQKVVAEKYRKGETL